MAKDVYEEFWDHVRRHLQERFNYSEPGARKAQEHYQERLRQHEALDAVYHSMPADVAESIHGGGYTQGYRRE